MSKLIGSVKEAIEKTGFERWYDHIFSSSYA